MSELCKEYDSEYAGEETQDMIVSFLTVFKVILTAKEGIL